MTNEFDIEELPEFDERSVRRSIRRGIARTVAITVLVLLVGALVLNAGSQRIANPKTQRFIKVYGDAYKAANPGYSIGVQPEERRFALGPAFMLGAVARSAKRTNLRSSIQGFVRADFRGKISSLNDHTILPATPVSERLNDSPSKESTRILLSKLPVLMSSLAIVELAEGLDESTLRALRSKHGICYSGPERLGEYFGVSGFPGEMEEIRCQQKGVHLGAILLEPPVYDRARKGPCLGSGKDRSNYAAYVRLSWPDPYMAHLRQWAKLLEESDDANLEQLLLPRSECFKELAKKGLAYGMIIEDASIADISALLDEEIVRSVSILDVDFDLQGG